MKNLRKLLIPVLLLAVVLIALFLPIEQLIAGIQTWVAANPSTALLAVTAGIILGTLLLLPLSLMLMLAGFLFGLSKGFAAVWLAGLVASTAAFGISRWIARPLIANRVQRKPAFIAMDRAIRRKGFLVVMLTRLVMFFPYPWLNYSLGLTAVSLKDYVFASCIGSVPVFFLFVYLGTTVSNITAIINGDIHLEGMDLLIAITALLVVTGLVLLIIRIAGKVLKEELVAARKTD